MKSMKGENRNLFNGNDAIMKIAFAAAALAACLFWSPPAPAADSNPPLLCDAETLAAPTKTVDVPVGGGCPPPPPPPEEVSCPLPPPPACPPEETPPPEVSCPPPPPPACPPEETKEEICDVVEVPVRTVVNEVRTVTVKKRVWDEEHYVADEKRTEVVNEVRTRTATRMVPTLVPRMVTEAKIIAVKNPGYGSARRLARGVNRKVVIAEVKVPEQYEETYVKPVRHTVTVPVLKTRKVRREVEEVKTVTVPVTVTTMESRLVAR